MRFSSDQAMALGYDGAPTRTAAWKRDFELSVWIWELEMEGKKDMARWNRLRGGQRRCLLLLPSSQFNRTLVRVSKGTEVLLVSPINICFFCFLSIRR